MSVVSSLSTRKAVFSVGAITVATALLVTGCGTTPQAPVAQPVVSEAPSASPSVVTDGEEEYVQVCEDLETQQRVEDENCDDPPNTQYRPSYYNYSSMIPAIGAGMLAGYLLSAPARSTVYRGAAPRTGGYAPSTRPNSGFLKVPDSFVGGPPVVPPAPSSAPQPVPSRATTPESATKPTTGATKPDTSQDKKTDKSDTKKKTTKSKVKTRRK